MCERFSSFVGKVSHVRDSPPHFVARFREGAKGPHQSLARFRGFAKRSQRPQMRVSKNETVSYHVDKCEFLEIILVFIQSNG